MYEQNIHYGQGIPNIAFSLSKGIWAGMFRCGIGKSDTDTGLPFHHRDISENRKLKAHPTSLWPFQASVALSDVGSASPLFVVMFETRGFTQSHEDRSFQVLQRSRNSSFILPKTFLRATGYISYSEWATKFFCSLAR